MMYAKPKTAGLDPADFLTLSKFLTLLPGAMPRANAQLLESLWFDGVQAEAQTVTVNGDRVSVSDLSELFHGDAFGTSSRVSPAGAAVLIQLYARGRLLMKPKAKAADCPLAQSYADSSAELAARSSARTTEADAYQARIRAPELIREEEFTYRLLNDVFWASTKSAEAVLEIGGRTVRKRLTAYRSNSGQSRDFKVEFSWVSSGGEAQCLCKESVFSDNRRNDEDRNYGLPE